MNLARKIEFGLIGGPEVLEIRHREPTLPGPGEVRLAVKAIGLNRAEAMLRAGRHGYEPQLPCPLGYEAAGVIDAIGEGVSNLQPGEIVSVVPLLSTMRWPSYGDYAAFPTELVIRHPLA